LFGTYIVFTYEAMVIFVEHVEHLVHQLELTVAKRFFEAAVEIAVVDLAQPLSVELFLQGLEVSDLHEEAEAVEAVLELFDRKLAAAGLVRITEQFEEVADGQRALRA